MNGRAHTWLRYGVRGMLILGTFMVPIIGDHFNVPVVPIALGALLAYSGLDDRTVTWSVVFLVIMELVWGMGLGTLSLPYLLTVLLIRTVEGFFTIEPLSRRSNWSSTSLLRTAILGWTITVVMVVLSIAVQSWLYGRGSIGELAGSSVFPMGTFLVMTGIGAFVTVACLYRIDVPFRADITFGV